MKYSLILKVIAYPIYEWPTKHIEVPKSCSNTNFPTCQNCGCTRKLFQLLNKIHYFIYSLISSCDRASFTCISYCCCYTLQHNISKYIMATIKWYY